MPQLGQSSQPSEFGPPSGIGGAAARRLCDGRPVEVPMLRRFPMLRLIVAWGVAAPWTAAPAFASPPPAVAALPDGITIEGRVEINAPADAVISLVRDPVKTLAASGSSARIAAGAQQGGCALFTWTVPNPILNVSWEGKHCRTAAGGETTLVRSDSIQAHRASFVVQTVSPTQSRLVYQVMTVPFAPIPSAIIRRQTEKEVTSFLTHLQAHLER